MAPPVFPTSPSYLPTTNNMDNKDINKEDKEIKNKDQGQYAHTR